MAPGGSLHLLGRRIPTWTLGVLALLAIGAVVALIARTGDNSRPAVALTTISVDDAPQDVDVGAAGVWVVNGGDRTAQPITSPLEPGADEGAGRGISLDWLPGGIAVGDDAVWVGAIEGSEILRIDPTAPRREAIRRIVVGETPQSVVGEQAVWVASFDDGSIWKIIMEGDRPVAESFELDDAFPSAIATGFGSVWITDVVANTVIRMDEVTGIVTQEIAVGDSPTAVAVGTDGVWVANFNDATVTHIDPKTNRQVGQPIIVGGRPGGIAAGEGFVWVTRPESDSVIRIDPTESEWTGEVFDVGDGPQGIAAGDGSIWTADQGSDTVTRLTVQR